MEIARIVSKRSTCLRRSVGAVIVKEKRILSTGYNGPPTGLAHCEDVGCVREQQNVGSGERHELCRGLHAEQNAIIQAAYHGVPILNAGLTKVFFLEGYPDDLASRLIEESGIIIEQLNVISSQ
jgi:dCMP deaminase